jgi:spermidine synthase
MKRLSYHFSFFSYGIATLTIQVILIRELLVVFSGNELSIGMFLSQWLFAQAIGSFVFRKKVFEKSQNINLFIFLFVSFTFTFPLIIFLIRTIKPIMGILPGEQISFYILVLVSFFLFFLPGFIGGAIFSVACRLFTGKRGDSITSISYVYGMEAAGSLVGGLLATYFSTKHLFPFEIAFGIIILSLITNIWLLLSIYTRLKRLTFLLSSSLLLLFIFWLNGGVKWIHQKSLSIQWGPYAIRDYHNTVYGNIVMLQRMGQTDIVLNGTPIAHLPTPDIIKIEETAHLSLLSHNSPKNVLLLGNGLDGVIPEILKHPIKQLDYVEPDSELVTQINKIIPRESITPGDTRLRIVFSDGREYLNKTDKRYDLIILNYPEPSTLHLNRFYTREFLQLCKRHLSYGGNLVIQMLSSSTYLNLPQLKLNASLIQTGEEVFQHQFIIPDETATIIFSDVSLSLSQPATWNQRFLDRNIETRFISQKYFRIKLDSLKSDWYEKAIADVQSELNTDLHPAAVWYNISLWISINEPELLPVLNLIDKCEPLYLNVFIIILTILIMFILKRSDLRNNSIVYIPILTTGFTGMSLSILLLLLFQSCYGYIYYWLGYLIAAFMSGIAMGTLYFGTQIKKNTYHYLLILEFCFIFLLSTMLIFINQDYHLVITQSFKYVILITAIIGGVLVGAEFPVASNIKSGNKSSMAGSASGVYAMDLFGAGFGGIITSVIFIPVFGIPETIFILLLLKACSIILLLTLRSQIK